MQIVKDEFESYLSVATSSHVEVFEKVEPHFLPAFEECRASLLGEAGAAAADDDRNTLLVESVKRWVSIHAFLSVFRQLDLVLTPTGFGVVSTQQVAPASKQRVDALVGHLRDSELRTRGSLLEQLCQVEGWGDSPQAQESIDTLFFDFRLLQRFQGPGVSHLDWQSAQRLIADGDEALRQKLSNEYMDALLDGVRHGATTEANRPIIFQCRRILSHWIAGDPDGARLRTRRLLSFLDDHLEQYEIYGSHGYTLNHHETFQNTEDAPAYLFG